MGVCPESILRLKAGIASVGARHLLGISTRKRTGFAGRQSSFRTRGTPGDPQPDLYIDGARVEVIAGVVGAAGRYRQANLAREHGNDPVVVDSPNFKAGDILFGRDDGGQSSQWQDEIMLLTYKSDHVAIARPLASRRSWQQGWRLHDDSAEGKWNLSCRPWRLATIDDLAGVLRDGVS